MTRDLILVIFIISIIVVPIIIPYIHKKGMFNFCGRMLFRKKMRYTMALWLTTLIMVFHGLFTNCVEVHGYGLVISSLMAYASLIFYKKNQRLLLIIRNNKVLQIVLTVAAIILILIPDFEFFSVGFVIFMEIQMSLLFPLLRTKEDPNINRRLWYMYFCFYYGKDLLSWVRANIPYEEGEQRECDKCREKITQSLKAAYFRNLIDKYFGRKPKKPMDVTCDHTCLQCIKEYHKSWDIYNDQIILNCIEGVEEEPLQEIFLPSCIKKLTKN